MPAPTGKGIVVDEVLLLPASLLGAGFALSTLTAITAVLLIADRRPWGALLVVASVASARLASLLVKAAFEAPRPGRGVLDPFTSPGVTLPIIAISAVLFAIALRTRWQRAAIVGLLALIALVVVDDVTSKLVPVRHGFDSFPSGHAVGSAALAFAAILAVWRSPRRRLPVVVLGAIFIAAVGLSRIYLREHYPADVVAGWSLAALSVVATTAVMYALRGPVESAVERWRQRRARRAGR